MASFKFSIDEDLLLIRTRPGLLNYILFFKRWSYHIELPTSRISRVEVMRRARIPTLMVVKKSKDGTEKSTAICLLNASKKQLNFIKHALPIIISEKSSMQEIKKYKEKYLD